MARNRSGADLIDDAMKRADVEGETARHPRAEVLRYVNQGKAKLRDLLIEARGVSYFRASSPWTFTTTADTVLYTASFPAAFMRMISVRVSEAGAKVRALDILQPLEEPELLDTDRPAVDWPTHYDLRPLGIGIYPRHKAGLTVTVEYIAASDDLTDASNSYADGVNGWEEYIVEFAARCIAKKDDEQALANECREAMREIAADIARLAPARDQFRPRRAQDVRGARMFGRMGGGGGSRRRWPGEGT
ncbi:MAG TPA: hypothetical protein VFN70_18180 [Burkholderiales bacterium]|nr:hypothetical protein [Burkholderiales bacterium]